MSKRKYRHLAIAVQTGLMVGALGLFQPVGAAPALGALPAGGISNSAQISIEGLKMTVDGQAAHNIIAWQSFNVGENAAVAFVGTKDYLNYVAGVSPSEIYGTLSGGGNVYIVNPNGILFGETAQINVGHLYASTRNITQDDLSKFEADGVLNSVIPDGGNIVNRMESDLYNMNITLEGDVVTFAKTVYDSDNKKVTLGMHDTAPEGQELVNYTVKANTVNIGYDGTLVPFYATKPTTTNLTNNATKTNYAKLIGQSDLSAYLDCVGNYMLKEDISGPVKHSSEYFSGVFDGAGHSAALSGTPLFNKNSSIDESYNNAEFVGASVYNLTLTGTVTGGANENIGALVRSAYGTTISGVVNKAKVTGSVTSYDGDGMGTGGLVGFMADGTLKNSHNEGDVTLENTDTGSPSVYVGGLVGILDNATVSSVYNKGQVTGSGPNYVFAGGLAGQISGGSIERSYNTGTVTGAFAAGGLAGVTVNWVTFTNVFNEGTVNSGTHAGALAGKGADGGGTLNIEKAYSTVPFLNLVGNNNANIKLAWKPGGSSYYYDYYDSEGAFHSENIGSKTPAAYLAEKGFTAANGFIAGRGYMGQGAEPLLKTFMTPLNITDKTVTYNGGEQYLFYHTKDLSSYYYEGWAEGSDGFKKTEKGTYTATFKPENEDQFGFEFVNVKPTLTIKAASTGGGGGGNGGGTGGNGGGGNPTTPDNPPVQPDNPPVQPDNPPVQPDNPPAEPDPVQPEPSDPGLTAEEALTDEHLLENATHQEGSDSEDSDGENALTGAASKAAIDLSHGVQHVHISEEAVNRMVGGEGADISSSDTGEIKTEHIEVSDFSGGDGAGEVEK